MRRVFQCAVSLLAASGLFNAAAAQIHQAPQPKHSGNPLDIVSVPSQGSHPGAVRGGTVPP